MRKIICVLAGTLFYIAATAQKTNSTVPVFGKVDKEDLQMTDCDFDPKANAVILADEGEMNYIYNSGFEIKRRVRIKVLASGGLTQADIKLPYYSAQGSAGDITGLEAQTYNLDPAGNVTVTKVEKKLIYDKRIDKRTSERIFTFPEVKVGSIIEYRYKETGSFQKYWYFQYDIPVKYSRFKVDFPQEVEFYCAPHCSRNYSTASRSEGRRMVKEYTMTNCPGFRDEPFIINEDFYRDRLEPKITAINPEGEQRVNWLLNWVQVIRALMEDDDFGAQLKKNIPRTADLDLKLKSITAPYLKMKTIYKYVQENMSWNELNGIWALDGVKSAWKDKKGTTGEINLILVNLLKDADLDANPILVSTHDNGVVNSSDAGTRDYFGYRQFNKVMAYVKIDDKTYVLDATEKETPPHLIPPDVMMTEGLVIQKVDTYEWGWQTIWDPTMLAKNVIVSRVEIDGEGHMKGESTISSYDYARLSRLATAKKGKDKYIERYGSSETGALKVDDVEFENLDSDSLPLIQKVKFTEDLNSSGDYRYFSANILSGLEKNPFVADNRYSDVFFGNNQSYLFLGSFILPEGYEFDELPKNLRMIMPDTSISILRQAQVSGNVLMTKIQLDFKSPVFSTAQYGEFQEFYKQLFNILNEQFVVRKKKG